MAVPPSGRVRPKKRQATKPRKRSSSVRHTRAIQRDRTQRPVGAPLDEQVTEQLTEVIHPATLAQLDYYWSLGLRERVLTLPVMVALVLTMIWRQVGSVGELVRLLRCEGLLWRERPVRVSQQALSQRLRTFPADLFRRVLLDVLPTMQARWQSRTRPLPKALALARQRYSAVLALDGSTLDALLKKVGLLRDRDQHPLAGRMAALLDVASRLPQQLWFEEDPQAHDMTFWERAVDRMAAGTLLLFDLGFTHFGHFAELTRRQITFITRAKSNLAYQVERTLLQTAQLREALVFIGSGQERQRVRLVAVLVGKSWHRFLTNELSPERLPAAYVAALYGERWRIEDAYAVVKRLLGLAYFWVGSQNGVQLQLWATWLLYAVLVDLTDAVAERLQRPFAALSLEMVYRNLFYFTRAYHRGEAEDPVAYLATEPEFFGVVKRKRKSRPQPVLDRLLTIPVPP
jgi:hypothetical protein